MIRVRQAIAVPVTMWMMLSGSGFGCYGVATADPEDPGVVAPPPPPPASVSWPQLGRSDRLEILGSDQPFDTDIPVPEAVTPGTLTGQIGSAINVVGGRVDIVDGRGVVLGSVDVPPDQTSVPFAVDISAAQILAGVARLGFVLRQQNPPGDSCSRPPSVTLTQLGSSYLGEAPYPAVVADFKPGYVEQILIRTGPSPTPAQQQAALELVAKLTRAYRPIPVRFDIDLSAEPAPPGPPTRRVIELREADSPGMTVRNPGAPDAALVISGRGGELSDQVQLFSDRRVELAQAPDAAVKSVTHQAPRGSASKTFAQLGITGEVSVLGTATMYIGFDAAQFAVGPVQEANLNLRAHYTPVNGGEASVVVRSGNSVLASRRLDESGWLDLSGTIPAEAIASNIGIAVQLRYLPSQRCAPLNDRIQFTVDPDSTITVTPGSHNRGGFPVLPMAFTPEFNVAIDWPEHLRYAARAVNLLAQQSTETLQPRVTPLLVATRSGLGALIVAPVADLTRLGLRPPVRSEGGGPVGLDGNPGIDVDLNGPIGVIQAFTNQNAMTLAIGATGDWNLVDRCFDYIGALPSRWASLSGDVVATGVAGRSVNLTLREGGALLDEYPGDSWKWWAWATLAVGAAALLTVGIVLWGRHIRAWLR